MYKRHINCFIGGDVDGASKTLIGIATDPTQLDRTSFLIAVSNNKTSVGQRSRL